MRNNLLAKLVLLPLSKLFGMVVWVRNQMFDRQLFLKSTKPKVKTVVVGNLAVGGTGKTPHTEYIVRRLAGDYHVGVLSRGYKRKTKGYVMANSRTSPDDIGDEAFQVYHKFGPETSVAVCEKRVEGIDNMLQDEPHLDLIVLDDAFQHRYVDPTLSIVLTEFSRPVYSDSIMPYGTLREPVSSLKRADIVVVTKCPDQMQPIEFRMFKEHLNLFPYQRLFFSRLVYGHLVALFPEQAMSIPYLEWLEKTDTILVVTGIANPRPFVNYLRKFSAKVKLLCYPDHHSFDHDDIAAIKKKYSTMVGKRKFIITTEKDAVRLGHCPYYPSSLKPVTFYLPVSVEFITPPTSGDGDFDDVLKKKLNEKPLP